MNDEIPPLIARGIIIPPPTDVPLYRKPPVKKGLPEIIKIVLGGALGITIAATILPYIKIALAPRTTASTKQPPGKKSYVTDSEFSQPTRNPQGTSERKVVRTDRPAVNRPERKVAKRLTPSIDRVPREDRPGDSLPSILDDSFVITPNALKGNSIVVQPEPSGQSEREKQDGDLLGSLVTQLLLAVEPEIRLKAANELRRLGKKSLPAISSLVAAIDDKYPPVRLEVIATLTDFGSDAIEAVDSLEKSSASKKNDEITKKQAAIAILTIAPESAEARRVFSKAIASHSPQEQVEACRTIADSKVTPKWAEKLLRENLKDAADSINSKLGLFEVCAKALGNLRECDTKTLSTLKKYADSEILDRAKLAADTAYRKLLQATKSSQASLPW